MFLNVQKKLTNSITRKKLKSSPKRNHKIQKMSLKLLKVHQLTAQKSERVKIEDQRK